MVDLHPSACDFQGDFGEGGVRGKSPGTEVSRFSAAQGHTMKSAKSGQNLDQVSLLVHEISNMICSIRMHASSLSVDPNSCESAHEILDVSRQIEARVMTLAAMAEKPSPHHKSEEPTDRHGGKG